MILGGRKVLTLAYAGDVVVMAEKEEEIGVVIRISWKKAERVDKADG